ncbi:hypothetical protein QQG55_37940 [Brugia pahangi]
MHSWSRLTSHLFPDFSKIHSELSQLIAGSMQCRDLRWFKGTLLRSLQNQQSDPPSSHNSYNICVGPLVTISGNLA